MGIKIKVCENRKATIEIHEVRGQWKGSTFRGRLEEKYIPDLIEALNEWQEFCMQVCELSIFKLREAS